MMNFSPMPRPAARIVLGVRTKTLVIATAALVTLQISVLAPLAAKSNANLNGKANAKPSPRYSPQDVIAIQIRALSAPGEIETRVERCYRFASPENRTFTGPLGRFAQMLQTPQYRALLEAKHFLVGRPILNRDEAHLMLSIVDGDGELRLFRCFLSKQSGDEYADCWMTDAVIPVGVANPLEQLRSPSASPTI